MLPLLASTLVFDTDQDQLFCVDDLPYNTPWVSARVYKTGTTEKHYEVWLYEWDPISNTENPNFSKAFEGVEEAKKWAIQLVNEKMPKMDQ